MSETLTHQQKKALRQQMREILKNLPTQRRLEGSADICQTLTKQIGQHSLTVASFVGLPSEPDLSALHINLPRLRLVYPRSLADGVMHFHHLSDLEQMELGPYAIPQPPNDPSTLVAPAEIDLFLCPGFAFSTVGKRLGKGGGYYDRLLSQRSETSQLIGICFSEQLTDTVPTEEHDIRVDLVIHG